MDPGQILSALADLAPDAAPRILDVTRAGQPVVWLADPDRAHASGGVNRLAALDALHRDERIVRRGCAFVLGGGSARRVMLPLLTQPVRLVRDGRGYRVTAAGDLELTPLIADRALAAQLEAVPGLGTAAWLASAEVEEWIRAAAAAAGVPVDDVGGQVPRRRRDGEHAGDNGDAKQGDNGDVDQGENGDAEQSVPEDALHGVAAAGLYVVRDVAAGGLRGTLLGWASRPGLASTALATVYGQAAPGSVSTVEPPPEPVISPLPLNAAQREVVRRARAEPLTVVSGPPGNGKSHAVVAAALEVVDRGGSVLVATQSTHAADVLGDLLSRYPGPAPVLFGDAELRATIAIELGSGLPAASPESARGRDEAAVAAAVARMSQWSRASPRRWTSSAAPAPSRSGNR